MLRRTYAPKIVYKIAWRPLLLKVSKKVKNPNKKKTRLRFPAAEIQNIPKLIFLQQVVRIQARQERSVAEGLPGGKQMSLIWRALYARMKKEENFKSWIS